ncbi:MAG TPA: YidC/Oxa1 family membrane protein insertase [Solirubrobacterales bacterium]|jgi:YidC/Oxa1 family membrane protein insertase|nr:YidC/Oxa1 family membrane protein insertase [Solirubrobacterales bacterium]
MIPANILQPLIDIANSILMWLHDPVGLEYGLAIVILTFITRAAILPLSVKQIRSMREMSAIQPQLKEIQNRYKDDRERLQRESMRLFQEHGVNPFASCLPLLLQLPVFISLFYLLQSDEFKEEVQAAGQTSWLFIDNLTEKATGSALIILLILYIGTSLIAGLIMTGRNAAAQQRMIALGLPLVFTPIMIGFPAGLLVYWISTNIWTMGQQAVVKIFFPAPATPTPEEVQASKPPPPPPRKKKKRR